MPSFCISASISLTVRGTPSESTDQVRVSGGKVSGTKMEKLDSTLRGADATGTECKKKDPRRVAGGLHAEGDRLSLPCVLS